MPTEPCRIQTFKDYTEVNEPAKKKKKKKTEEKQRNSRKFSRMWHNRRHKKKGLWNEGC